MLAQHRSGTCFCTRGAMQGYDGYYLILAAQKAMTYTDLLERRALFFTK